MTHEVFSNLWIMAQAIVKVLLFTGIGPGVILIVVLEKVYGKKQLAKKGETVGIDQRKHWPASFSRRRRKGRSEREISAVAR
jgi:hypothetical protein